MANGKPGDHPVNDILDHGAAVFSAEAGTLVRHDAVLDELQPERCYLGRVRWVCPKANNSGKRSCGAY